MLNLIHGARTLMRDKGWTAVVVLSRCPRSPVTCPPPALHESTRWSRCTTSSATVMCRARAAVLLISTECRRGW
jgi:hypothetical protein